VGKRKIWFSEEEDQLRWGRTDGGEFSLKEARHYIAGQAQRDMEPHWERLWSYPQWTKIKIFKWLVLQKKILTWENLVKRGFHGPSRCHLCEGQEETTDHLLDECTYATEIWDWVAMGFLQTDRVKGDIRATLKNWKALYSENEVVNLCWGLTPGMVIWEIWKERNMRLFRNESYPTSKIVDTIKTQLRETVQSRNFTCQKNTTSPHDLRILLWLQLKEWSLNLPSPHAPRILSDVKTWSPPQISFLKLNFDGASKGNPERPEQGECSEIAGGILSACMQLALAAPQTMQLSSELWNKVWIL
jgi:hypothetical protein